MNKNTRILFFWLGFGFIVCWWVTASCTMRGVVWPGGADSPAPPPPHCEVTRILLGPIDEVPVKPGETTLSIFENTWTGNANERPRRPLCVPNPQRMRHPLPPYWAAVLR